MRGCPALVLNCVCLCPLSLSLPIPLLSVCLSPWGLHTPGPGHHHLWLPWQDWCRICSPDRCHEPSPVSRMSRGVTGGRPLRGEGVSTIARVLAHVGGSHRAQREVCPREPSLGLPAKLLGRVRCPLFGQSVSVVANIRATLEGQSLSRGHERAMLGQEGGLPRHTWERPAMDGRSCLSPNFTFS